MDFEGDNSVVLTKCQRSNSLDGSSSAGTERCLISSAYSETTINSAYKTDCYDICKKKRQYVPPALLVTSFICTALGIISIIWTPFHLLMNERLKMTPSLPPFKWWLDPPDEVLMRVYVFNVTNTDEFLNGIDKKLKLEEIGPIIFLEKLTHTNVSFNDNDTLSYTATRKPVYLPELNTINLNQTIYTPNMALLGMASYLSDAAYLMKIGFKLMMTRANPKPFVKITINDFMWNYTEPLLEAGHSIMPSMVPVDNMGILERIYSDFSDDVTVYVGTKHGNNKFFLMNRYHGSEYLPYWGDSCRDKVLNATEGVLYPQMITKSMSLKYYRKTMCKVTPLYYDRDDSKYGLSAYRFTLPGNSYNRTKPLEADCYRSYPPLLDGLTDVSKCQYQMPMAASFPHFLYGDKNLGNLVSGLSPTEDKHGSFAIVEPTTGIPLEGKARSQSNLIIRDLSSFSYTLKKFSNSIIPLFWIEYHQVGLPYYVLCLVYFQVTFLPIFQYFLITFWFFSSIVCIYKFIQFRKSRGALLQKNARIHFEAETFIKEKV